MANKTLIAWTDHTWNPWMGCAKYSAGCANCYAETLTKNTMGLNGGTDAPRQITTSTLKNVLRWQEAAARGVPGILGNGNHLVFVGSLMDWTEDRPDLVAPRQKMWQTIKECPQLWFQLLTKRAENIEKFLPPDWGAGSGYSNVWLGTSIEDMRVADRADLLKGIPAVVKFISY